MVVRTSPPAAESVREIVKPSVIDWTTILTLVGGTVGGYITFSGAHRIIDAGIVGTENLGRINRGSLNGILITGIMRFLLFMAVLGVVVTGVKLDPSNPAADAFRIAAGEVGYRIFGIILWSAEAGLKLPATMTVRSLNLKELPAEYFQRLNILLHLIGQCFLRVLKSE